MPRILFHEKDRSAATAESVDLRQDGWVVATFEASDGDTQTRAYPKEEVREIRGDGEAFITTMSSDD